MIDASLQRHWMPDVQPYAVGQERSRHLDALYALGECSIFALMWRVQDYEKGLVGRCPTCYLPEQRTAEAFGQAKRERCPDCFGTTFEGGFRAIIERPSIWDVQPVEQHTAPRGDTFVSSARVQTTDDFSLNTDDYVFRRDGTRWQIRKTDWDLLRTGFGFPIQPDTLLGWNLTSVDLEDRSSTAYMLPPTPEEVTNILTHQIGDHLGGCGDFELLHGPVNQRLIRHRTVVDAAPTTDSAKRSGVFGRHVLDGYPAIGSATRRIIAARSALDVSHALDTPTRHITLIRHAFDLAPTVDVATRVKVPHRTAHDNAPAVDAASRSITRKRTPSDAAPAVDSVATIGPLGGSQVTGANVHGDFNGARGMGFEVTAPVIVTGVSPQFYSTPDGTAGCRVGIATGVDIGTLCRFPNWLSDGSGHQCFADIPIGTSRANFPGAGFSLVPGTFYVVVVANLSNTSNVANHVTMGSNGTTETTSGVIKFPGYNNVYNGGASPGSDAGTFTGAGDFPQIFGGNQRGFKLYGHP